MDACYWDENGNDPGLNYKVNDQNILGKAGIRPLAAANCTDYVVAHSDSGIRPVRQFSEVALLPPILETMQKLGLNRLLRVQSHSWPHLAASRHHGAMIVAAPKSGRTFSYIPPLCDVVRRAILNAKRWEVDNALDLMGPLAVILVPDLERVRQVGSLCYAFLKKATLEETYTLTLGVPSVMKPEFFHRLFNGVGILVATPAQLVWALEDSLEKFRAFPHLQFLVYDDVDLMQPELLEKAEQLLKKLVPKDRSYPQLVAVSQSYDSRLMAKLKLWNSKPSLIFGDILEAALYGQTRLRIVLCPEQEKVGKVCKMLEKRPPSDYRTVIFCRHDGDMRRLVGLLEERYSCLPYYQDSNLAVAERVHRWLAESRGLILLATDDCPELNIRHAHTLIHYSMSKTWGKFKMRHLFISGNLLPKKEEERLSLHSLVLLDDSNQKQLPRLVDFLEKHQKVDAAVVALAKHIRQQTARDESANQNVVCRQIMELGDCISPNCDERHFVGRQDRASASIPTSGDVKVRLVRVYSPTHFCVHLLEHLPPAGKSWQAYPSLAVTHMNLQLLQPSKNERYWPPVPGAVCLHRSSTSGKERVRVLKVAPIENVNLASLGIEVLVQAMDTDTRIFQTKSGSLYACSEELQKQPPMAIDLRLLGMVPFSGERNWSEEDRKAIEYKLEHLPQDHFLQAIVQFATSHTLFVRNMMAITYESAMKFHVQRLNLCRHLTEEKMAKSCERAKEKIVAFFGDGEEEEPEEEVQKKQKEEGVKKQRALEKMNNNNPPKPILKGRLLRLTELGKESGRQNRLAREQEQEMKAKKEEQEVKAREQEQELKAKKEEQELKAQKEEKESKAKKEEQHLEAKKEEQESKAKEQQQELEAKKEEQESKAKKEEQESKAKKEEQESKAKEQQPELEAKEKEQEDGMAQLYRCIRNCTLQERQNEALPKNERLDLPGPTITEFLDRTWQNLGIPNPTPSAAAKPKTSKNKVKPEPKASAAPLPPSKPPQLQLPPNVVRPPTTYYQTKTTLELQVLLPDEGYEYHALLTDNQLLFVATCQASPLRHQFVLNLNIAYSSLSHYTRGRTVYISVKKTVAMVDPLDFHAYQNFLKANHDMYGKLEEEMQAQALDCFAHYAGLGKDMPVKREEEEEQESSEEERNMDGIERGDDKEDCVG